jgi:enoyl-CoA hydratase
MAEPEVLLEARGRLGLVTLNRPQALNALNLDMVRLIDPQLRAWAIDPAISAVVIRGQGARAFCAGGDIRKLHELGSAGRKNEAMDFWREEYRLNALIKNFPKPYVALIEGVVMGGGVGLSIHGSHRVAAEKITFAMPEVGIGYFPDVGATYFLPRLPRRAGMWLALTGARIGTADALSLGLMTHHVPSARFDAVIAALAAGEGIDDVLRRDAQPLAAGNVLTHLTAIERLFSGASVEAILAMLDAETNGDHAAFASEAAAAIRTKSPTSLKLAFEQIRRGAAVDFDECLRIELRLDARILDGRDYYEGVRAVVIDKDNAPRWQPARLEDVSEAEVAAYFAPLGSGELRL